MANGFVKEEIVAFEEMLEGFHDQEIMSGLARVYNTDSTTMERASNVIWRPQPYVSQSFDGMDQTLNFKPQTQLSVPATLGFQKSSPWTMDALELRDALQEGRLLEGAKQKLASDINIAILNVASLQGSLVVKRTTAAAGYADVAQMEAIMNEQGIGYNDRCAAFSTRDYNGMADNLAGRQTMQGKPTAAYENGFVGRVASFDTYKLDYSRRLGAAAGGGGITISTLDAGGNVYTPVAKSTSSTGETGNVDNRFQRVTVSSTTSVVAGDAFTVATLEAVHHITKQSTGQLKTFRVVSVDSSTTMTITPPLITNQVPNDASAQYQNCTIGTKASNSAIVFLNTVAGATNPFWQKDAIEILPGRYAVPTNSGMEVMRASTKRGIDIVFSKFTDINTYVTKYRVDTLFGVVNKQPEMSGIILFSQS